MASLMRACALLALFMSASVALAAAPTLDDYARGLRIDAAAGLPLVEITLPDEVYQSIRRGDLSDMRVFNAEGAAVRHALCLAPTTTEPTVTELSLPVYELREARAAAAGASVEVQTTAGTRVNVQDGVAAQDAVTGGTHIIDARQIDLDIRAVQFDWQSPDGASQARVRIDASDDLDRWNTIVAGSTLLSADANGTELRRERIELPQGRYDYLRVERVDGGPPLQLLSATAEQITPAAELEPQWFMATQETGATSGALTFDTARVAPVSFARVRLPDTNMSLEVSLQSRDDVQAAWVDRWSGESYVIVSDTQRRESPPARFAPTTDRYWRLQWPKDALTNGAPALELGYRPALLRFMAQGSAPYTLAFGSVRAEPAAHVACDALVGDVRGSDREDLIADGYIGASRELAGELAFKPLPERTPVRVMVLWGVLVVAVASLIAMAVTLLKRIRPEG